MEEKDKKRLTQLINLLLPFVEGMGMELTYESDAYIKEFISTYPRPIIIFHVKIILFKMKQLDLTSLSDFEYWERELVPRKSSGDEIVLLMPYDNNIFRRKFTINGTLFKIIDSADVSQYISRKKIIELLQQRGGKRTRQKLPFKFMVIVSKGYFVTDSWTSIMENHSIYRALYDWHFHSGITPSGNSFHSLTNFRHPEWVISKGKDGVYDVGFFTVPLITNVFSVQRRSKTSINRLLKYVEPKAQSHSTRSLLYDCFRLYEQAMESTHKHNAFLGFWQMIETCCLAGSGTGKTKTIIQRLNVIVAELKVYKIDLLNTYDRLAWKRNILVHRGIDQTDQSDITIIKTLAEYCIQWLFNKENKLGTKTQLDDFFRQQLQILAS
jgi:hypothetical protein